MLRAIYGLKLAARVWNQKIQAFLMKIGFVRSTANPCLYVDTKQNIYITPWLDDLLIAGKNGRDIANVKAQLAVKFEMKNLGELKHFLGMRIMRNPSGGFPSIKPATSVKYLNDTECWIQSQCRRR